ncbi:hypothetical protein MPER_10129, partial [Moniliophthora perniciosa FA553]
MSKFEAKPAAGKTFSFQDKLPKLPIPPLEDTCKRKFLENDGPIMQEKLFEYAKDKDSDPVVLALNPFFVLENDPTPDRGSQLPRAASLIVSSLGFIHDLRAGLLEPDTIRGVPLDMDQYTRIFGTARIPTGKGCRMEVTPDSNHIVVLRRGQF